MLGGASWRGAGVGRLRAWGPLLCTQRRRTDGRRLCMCAGPGLSRPWGSRGRMGLQGAWDPGFPVGHPDVGRGKRACPQAWQTVEPWGWR